MGGTILPSEILVQCWSHHGHILTNILHSVLSKINMSIEGSLASTEETAVVQWVQQELPTIGHWHPSMLEAWYHSPNVCGAGSDLMESFRLLLVSCANEDNADQSEVELSESLSELYQRKFSEISATAGPGNNRKRRMYDLRLYVHVTN